MREHLHIHTKPYIYFTPENDDQFEAILELTRAIHGEGAVALSRSLDAGLPGMCREDWYGLAAPEDWPDGRPAPTRVISTLCRIPTFWTCADAGTEVSLPSAELGMVASAEDARGRGLSSWLMKRFQDDSIKAGFSLSTIQGIPYFYRRFGYEYAVPLIPKIILPPVQSLMQAGAFSGTGAGIKAAYTAGSTASSTAVRKAEISDIPMMSERFKELSLGLGVKADRSPDHWVYLLGKAQSSFETAVDRRILLDGLGKPVGWIGFQRECFGPTLAIAEASLPDPGSGWSAGAMLSLAEYIRAEEGLPHITVLLPRSHPVAVAAAGLGGQVCREYAWQVAILDRPAFFGLLRPVIESRLRKSGWQDRARCLDLDLYTGGLRFDWDGKGLEITQLPDHASSEGMEQAPGAESKGAETQVDHQARQPNGHSGGQAVVHREDGIDTMPEMPVSSFPPELLGPLMLGYRSWQELGHCRRDVMIRPEDRSFMDAMFPVMDSFIYPLF